MNLELLLSSKARARILALLFEQEREFYMRQLERETKLSIGAIQQEIRNLKKLELVQERRDGNRLYFRIDRTHPLYGDLRQIVLKTSTWVSELRKQLTREDISFAFIFGSFARSEARSESDVDLFVVGKIGLRTLAPLIGSASRKIGRTVNPQLYSPEDFRKRSQERDHFVTAVLESEKIFLVGNEDELEKLGRARVAKTS